MKTVKTVFGLRRIEGEDKHAVASQLRAIIQDHRMVLIANLINGDLSRYIDYKFNMKMEPSLLNHIKYTLLDLKQSGVNLLKFGAVLESVFKFDFIELGNEPFFNEIDERIKQVVSQTELFRSSDTLAG